MKRPGAKIKRLSLRVPYEIWGKIRDHVDDEKAERYPYSANQFAIDAMEAEIRKAKRQRILWMTITTRFDLERLADRLNRADLTELDIDPRKLPVDQRIPRERKYMPKAIYSWADPDPKHPMHPQWVLIHPRVSRKVGHVWVVLEYKADDDG